MGQTLRSQFTDAEFWIIQMLASGHSLSISRIAEVTGLDEEAVPARMSRLAMLFGIEFNFNASGAIH